MSDEFCVPLSPQAKSLISESYQKLRPLYISDRITNSLQHFVDQYHQIKDQSWPDCNSYEDFDVLPEYIKQECISEHQFSPEIFIESIKRDAYQIFPDARQDFLRGQTSAIEMLYKNINLLENKRIIDFACKWGFYTFLAAENNCRHITGIDVRPDNLSIARIVKQTTKYQDSSKIDFEMGDLHDYSNNARLCSQADVIFLLGILYHVHDHYDVLRSICLPNIETVLIETGIYQDDNATIFWKTEPTFEPRAGWFDNLKRIPVGYPSVGYLDMIMESLGYRNTYQDHHDLYISALKTDEFKMPRACLIYQR